MTQQDITWVRAGQVFDGVTLYDGAVVGIAGGAVRKLATAADVAGTHVTPIQGLITPGFVDLQVNGGGGVLFNTTPTAAGIADIAAAHRKLGTTQILPTVITDSPEVLERAADAVLQAPGCLGLHIEGPHISVPRRGTHAVEHIRPLDERTFQVVERLRARDIPVMLTLAPEAATGAQIARLANTGAVVSIGHSDATAQDARAALSDGATCFTHLFNAMSPMLNRAPGVVGAAINSNAYAGIICDGIHVADEMVALAIRARPVADKMFIVSDAMPTVGGPDHFDLYGKRIHLENGALVNDQGGLAGAHVTMLQSYVRLVSTLGIAQETALRMCHTVPLDVMFGANRERQSLIGMDACDVMVIAPDGQFTWLNALT